MGSLRSILNKNNYVSEQLQSAVQPSSSAAIPGISFLHGVHTHFVQLLSQPLFSLLGESTVALASLQVIDAPSIQQQHARWACAFCSEQEPQGVLAFDNPLALAAIRHRLGVSDKSAQDAHRLSDLEQHLLRDACLPLLDAYRTAWRRHAALMFHVAETPGDVVPAGDLYQACYEVRSPQAEGSLCIELPLANWEPLLRQLAESEQPPAGNYHNTGLLKALAQCTVPTKVVLGTARITMLELLDLQEGDILGLDKDPAAPLEIHIANQPKLYGQAHVNSEQYVISIAGRVSEGASHES